MSESDSLIVKTDNGELRYYEQLGKQINSLSERFRAKSIIKQNVYNDIGQCLLLPKGKTSGFSAKFIYWAKHNFFFNKIAGVDFICCLKSKKTICVFENYYNVISKAHEEISHGGRTKTTHELRSHYSWIPRFAVEIFLKQCVACQTRKPLKQHVVSKPIISLGVMTRLQIDLIDMRTRPDTSNEGTTYKWILHCIDHFSKFTWAYSLRNKCATEVAPKLRELFLTFGPPKVLHSDNGREFVADVIFQLRTLFPDMLFIRGKPRHPQSQGCIERANGILTIALGKWLSTNNSSHWSEGLLPVVYGINTRISVVTRACPYQVMFGQEPRSNSEFWRIVQEKEILDEEDLPTPVADQDDTLEDVEVDIDDCADVVDSAIVQLVQQLSDEVAVSSMSLIDLIDQQSSPIMQVASSIEQAASPIQQAASPIRGIRTRANHKHIREVATVNYMNVASKKMNKYNSVLNEATKFNVNDCVGVKIHSVDRTNTDAKLLPCLIIEKGEKNDKLTFKLACQYGRLDSLYSIEDLVDLKMACPEDLQHVHISKLREITFIEACRLYARGSTTGRTCDCKTKCETKQCPCKKVGIHCSTKCHSKRGPCCNMGE